MEINFHPFHQRFLQSVDWLGSVVSQCACSLATINDVTGDFTCSPSFARPTSDSSDRSDLRTGARVWRLPSLLGGTNSGETEQELGLSSTGSDDHDTTQFSNTLDYVTTLPLDGFAHIRKYVFPFFFFLRHFIPSCTFSKSLSSC